MRFLYEGPEPTPVVVMAFSAAYGVEFDMNWRLNLEVDVRKLAGCRYVRVRAQSFMIPLGRGDDGDGAIQRWGPLPLDGEVVLLRRELYLSDGASGRVQLRAASPSAAAN